MKRAKLESKKIVKATKLRRLAGVQVRSSVKARRMRDPEAGGKPEFGGPRDPIKDRMGTT